MSRKSRVTITARKYARKMSTLALVPVPSHNIMRATMVTRPRRSRPRYGDDRDGPGRNLSFHDSLRPSGGGSRARVDHLRLSESRSLSGLSNSCMDLGTGRREEFREERRSGGSGGRSANSNTPSRQISRENSFSQSSNNVLTKRRSASLHRSETRPRRPSASCEGIDDVMSAFHPIKSSSSYSAPGPTGMSPKQNNRVRLNVSRSKSPAVIYVDNALNRPNVPGRKPKVSVKLIRGRKGAADTDNNARPSTRSSSRNRRTHESSKQRSGLGSPRTPDKKELRQRRVQRDEYLRRLKAEIRLPSNDRRRSHGDSPKTGTRAIERRRSDGVGNTSDSPGWTRDSAVRRRRTKRVSFSSGSDLPLSEVAEKDDEEFKSKSSIPKSLPSPPGVSTRNTPESPDDWHKYVDKVPRESDELPFDMTIDVPAMKSSLPFKSSDECRSIISRAKSLGNLPPPPPLIKHTSEKSGKGTRSNR